MDSVHKYIKETIDFYPSVSNLDELIAKFARFSGSDWIEERENPWDYRDVPFPELETRSALEFIRIELTPAQLESLNAWDKKYCQWRDEGIFFKRYSDAQGGRFTWEDERNLGKEKLGRSIPKSHWWYWPPDEKL